jgi:signal transduction histidine kinase/ActR/RegA family two-component response regulator
LGVIAQWVKAPTSARAFIQSAPRPFQRPKPLAFLKLPQRQYSKKMTQNLTEHVLAPAIPGFLVHGGEMGALISAMDWSDTPLGAPEGWLPALKGQLATLLSCPQPMFTAWGPDLLFFFNDAYRPVLGARFKGAMGRPFAELWSEIWAELEPIVNKTIGGEGSFHENMPLTLTRNGYSEPTWWSFSFTPLRDRTGAVAGMHCICADTTEQVLLAQQMAVKQKRQAFRLELNDALRDAADPKALMMIAAGKLGRHLHAGCVGYAEVDVPGDWMQVHHDWTAEGSPSVVGTHWLDSYGPAMMAEVRAGRTAAVSDTFTDPLAGAAYKAAFESAGARAVINTPLIKNGRLAVILFVIDPKPRVWTDDEKALVEEVAERTWASLQRLRAELDLRHVNRTLNERTTELLRSETALRQSQKLEALGQLTGGVAHDFNNLLAVISASVELLRSDKLPVERRGRSLDLIFDTVGRAVKLTSQLLAFARQQPLNPEVFDVNLQVQGVLDLVRPLMGAQVQIHHACCGQKCCFAEADINQFETALVNLAVNARDAMEASGQLTIKVQPVNSAPAGPGRGHRSGDFVAISVADTGCGIAFENLGLIFEPFYTTKEVGKGTGLGLSQVFGFTKQSGGEVEVRSELGGGSVFTLYLPRAETAPPPETVAAPAEHDVDDHGKGVLVVEDNETLAQMTCEILNTLGYHTTWAANATAALDLLAESVDHFDLVFSDVIMPGMNGIEFGELVRKHYPGLPVVLTSGYSAVIAEQGRHGFELILKPYTSDALVRVFRKAITAPTSPPHTGA